MIDQSQSQVTLKIDGPFAVGFDKIEKMYLVYNYDDEYFWDWKIED